MSFNSIEDAEKFYISYGKIAGFSVRKSSTKYHNIDGSKELYMRDFVCSKEGFKNPSTSNPKYTHKLFQMFQKEVVSSMQYGSMLKHSEGQEQIYIVKRAGDSTKVREIFYNSSNHEIACSCCKFENEGIPCSHILVVLRNNFIDYLPENLILERWTTTAKAKTVYDDDGVEFQVHTASSKWKGKKNRLIARGFTECLHDAPEEVCNVAEEMLDDLQKMKASYSASGSNTLLQSRSTSVPSSINVYPPNVSKTKGSGKRLKGGKEIAMEDMGKRRTCSVCGKKEKHNARTCPKLKEM
ncbi:hypothetical protein QJS04_geneDACA011558 [Acorus gramineus]|uniref:SWIM-type domain-containing protein n=1 Tax=Acorus gramineus TaxID=55184 RepID=A0AAV9ABK8_ACOGR|nr:hypothetical protein QJS04_geneDACA011558 [Acorus gramineus]